MAGNKAAPGRDESFNLDRVGHFQSGYFTAHSGPERSGDMVRGVKLVQQDNEGGYHPLFSRDPGRDRMPVGEMMTAEDRTARATADKRASRPGLHFIAGDVGGMDITHLTNMRGELPKGRTLVHVEAPVEATVTHAKQNSTWGLAGEMRITGPVAPEHMAPLLDRARTRRADQAAAKAARKR